MAAIIRKMFTVAVLLFVTTFLSDHAIASRVKQKIYIDLETQSACFRILNGTHEVGCTSSMKGNVGTIHYVQDSSDYEWILSKGPHDPYIAVLDGADFTGPIVRRLYKSSRVVGIMVINTHDEMSGTNLGTNPWPVDGFSTQEPCPNDQSGMYSNSSEYQHCTKGNWNTAASSLGRENIDIPVFALSTEKDVDNILNKCYFPFNFGAKNKSTDYPVCAAEMRSRMDAAVDSRTCIRRSNMFMLSLSLTSNGYCDPLGDHNVVATMMENDDSEPRKNDSVIVVAARIDSAALFMNEYKAADTTVTGFVTLLATAEALWKVKQFVSKDPNAKDIMYTFFHGETFDYIGSSRMVYDMRKNNFPSYPSDHSAKKHYLPKVELQHIAQIVELNQVGRRDDGNSLWAHSDPLGKTQVGTEVDEMISSLQSFSKAPGVSIQKADNDMPLPPASAQSFLKHRLDIPTVVLTDHQKAYTNKYYASRFDLPNFIDASNYPDNSTEDEKYDFVTKQAKQIADLSTALARYLYKASTGKEPVDSILQDLTGDSSTATHLLYCFMVSPSCPLFLETMDKENAKILKAAKAPYPFYVSVSDIHINEVTRLIHSLMARYTGDRLDVSKSKCGGPSGEKRFSYTWMSGPANATLNKHKGLCYKSTAFYTEALSPAFVIDDYDLTSGEYSTWTESVWGAQAIGVRIFLIPSPGLEASVLAVGIIILILSFAIVYFLYIRRDVLFSRVSQTAYDAIM